MDVREWAKEQQDHLDEQDRQSLADPTSIDPALAGELRARRARMSARDRGMVDKALKQRLAAQPKPEPVAVSEAFDRGFKRGKESGPRQGYFEGGSR